MMQKRPSVSQLQYLSTISLSYPLRNKAKTINSHLVNFEFENSLKQEVFLMEFDLEQAQ